MQKQINFYYFEFICLKVCLKYVVQARYARLKAAGDDVAAEEYLLSDRLASVHTVQSVQMFSENSLNPGLPSTFQFIRKVMQEIQALHKDIQPLRVFHLGGDEVPYQAWEESPACRWLIESGEVASFKDLMKYFVLKVREMKTLMQYCSYFS